MKYPLGMVALLYAGGLLLGELYQPPLAILFGSSLSLAAGAVFVSKLRRHLLWPLVVLTGWTMLCARSVVVSPHDLRELFGPEPKQVTVRCIVREKPKERTVIRNQVSHQHTVTKAAVLTINRGTRWEPVWGDIVIFTRGPAMTNIFVSDKVEVAGILSLPPLPLANGLFNYRSHLNRRGVYYQLRAEDSDAWTVRSPRTSPLSEHFLAWARRTLSRDLPAHDESLRLLLAMTLGFQEDLTNEIYEPFMYSGTMHIFAISGLHIAMIAGILVAVLRVARVPRFWSGMIVIPLIWFYTSATGWQPSAIRSTIMMSVIVGGWALNRPGNLLNSLGAAALIILLWDPQQLFQASFQLSFLVVLSIALFQSPLEKIRDRLLAADPLRPEELEPRWRRWLRVPIHHLTTALAISLAAWLGSCLLTAYYFHLFSPVTLLANLFIVPVSSAALASNLGSLLCGDWLPWVGGLFNHCAWFCMSAMVWFSQQAIHLPGAYFHVRSPTFADFIIFYTVLFAVLSGWVSFVRRRAWALLGLGAICSFYLWRWYMAQTTVHLIVLPLNGGHAVYCDAPGRANDLLVDCGNSKSVEAVTMPFLWTQGVNALPHLVLTHGDVRDIGGATPLQISLPARKVVTSTVLFRSPNYRPIIADLKQRPKTWRQVSLGDDIASWEVLHPALTNHFPRADDNALVLRGDFHGTRVLLLSDLGNAGQRALVDRCAELRADIVVVGLPEKAEPLNEAMLDAIQPRLLVIADSEFPAIKRASDQLRNRLKIRGIPVLYTRLNQGVTITLRPGGWRAQGVSGETITSAPIKN